MTYHFKSQLTHRHQSHLKFSLVSLVKVNINETRNHRGKRYHNKLTLDYQYEIRAR